MHIAVAPTELGRGERLWSGPEDSRRRGRQGNENEVAHDKHDGYVAPLVRLGRLLSTGGDARTEVEDWTKGVGEERVVTQPMNVPQRADEIFETYDRGQPAEARRRAAGIQLRGDGVRGGVRDGR